jgi:hypothetical protein
VVVLAPLVEGQRVLEARAAAAAHADAQADFALGLLACHEVADLARGDVGQLDHCPNCIGGSIGKVKDRDAQRRRAQEPHCGGLSGGRRGR